MSYTQSELEDLAQRYTDAWNSKIPEQVAAFHTVTSKNVVNRGEPYLGQEGVTEMAAEFHADVPDLHLVCDGIRGAGARVIYMWTFTGHHAKTGNPLKVPGWLEWDMDADMMFTLSEGWFDGEDYDRQIAG